ncbi:MAG: helix-turn-helix domain-containing protein [Actinomycetota bacterium]|nr:helix-turn-helix domain-containing protein [Actinomycetota bacterium]
MTERLMARVLGDEIRRARTAVGLSRAELAYQLAADIKERTIQMYELGTRQCTVARFIDICQRLDVAAPELLSRAMQRAKVDLHRLTVQVDLPTLLRDNSRDLEPLRGWAKNRLDASGQDGPSVVHLEPFVVRELAVLCGLTAWQFADRLGAFAPTANPVV